MSNKIKDFIGAQSKEKGRKRIIKPLLKSSEGLDEKGDAYKCKKRPWSEEEDQLVIKLVQEHGPQKWTFIATHLEGRIGKQCRERWHNHLNPNIKKCSWSEEEEWVLYLFHKGIGNKWAEIAKYILGRTDNSIKNHWNSGMKKRLDDYGRKLANVRELFEEVGESYFNRIILHGEKKALEILLLNKQYVPSDCDDDMDEEEEDEELSQDENINTINNSTTNNVRNSAALPIKEVVPFKEDLDSQKTKEKLSVNSKTQINPFTWNKAEEEQVDKNASTIKKMQPIPQLLKHSQSLQTSNTNHISNKENSTFTPKGNSTSLAANSASNSYSTILKENKNEMNKLRGDKKSARQVSPSLKEDPKKKVKVEEKSPMLDSGAQKKKKNGTKKESQFSQQNSGAQQNGKRKSSISASTQDIKHEDNQNESKQLKDQYQPYNQLCCEEGQQCPSQYHHHMQPSADDKEYNRQAYESSQSSYGAYHGGYNPYANTIPIQRNQSFGSYPHPPPPPPPQMSYPGMYMGPPGSHLTNSGNNVHQGHHNGNAPLHYNHGQQYKYDPHYYPHYQPMNFMYYPVNPSNPNSNPYPQQPYPYYKDYYNPKNIPPQQIPSQNTQNSSQNYPYQSASQHHTVNHPSQIQHQQSQQQGSVPPTHLSKSQSMPPVIDSAAYSEANVKNHGNTIRNKFESKQEKPLPLEEQSQSKREETRSSSYSQQIQSTSSTNNLKGFMDISYTQQDQANYLSTINSDFKYKQMDLSPFQVNRRSSISESLISSEEKDGNQIETENNTKVNRNNTSFVQPLNGINNHNLSMIHGQMNPHFGINYESPSKMLNLSERVMLKTVSSNKQYLHNMNSNIKYPISRSTIHPLNLNSLFNQEEDFFNDNHHHV